MEQLSVVYFMQHSANSLRCSARSTGSLACPVQFWNKRIATMDFHPEVPASYQVEVSGWDASENFFVEKTGLEWNREEKKEIELRSFLREGCIVFVRLLQSLGNLNTHAFPIAYQATKVLPPDSAGRTRVFLEQLRPRETFREATGAIGNSASKVA
jgi:hypothetical protein